jgi:hypothetical protein
MNARVHMVVMQVGPQARRHSVGAGSGRAGARGEQNVAEASRRRQRRVRRRCAPWLWLHPSRLCVACKAAANNRYQQSWAGCTRCALRASSARAHSCPHVSDQLLPILAHDLACSCALCRCACARGMSATWTCAHLHCQPVAHVQSPACCAGTWLQRHRRARNCAIAVRDYYHFWKSRNEFPRAGKLLLDNPADANTIQMFFDDNIGYTSAHIADARNARTGASLPFSTVQGAQLNRAEPVNAILDPKFFIRSALLAPSVLPC